MPANRFYTEDELKPGSSAQIRGAEHHHLAHVMRIEKGEEVELVNGRGFLAKATLLQSGRQEALASIEEVSFEPLPENRVIIAQALPKLNRLEFIIEKCTELGMDELWLFPGEKSEKKEMKETQLKRMEAIAISAMKQSGRLYLPKLFIKAHFAKWKEKLPENLFFGDVDPLAPKLLSAWERNREGSIVFFIGPESGFSVSETAALKKMGALGVKLHRNILRAETAPLVALSIIGMLNG